MLAHDARPARRVRIVEGQRTMWNGTIAGTAGVRRRRDVRRTARDSKEMRATVSVRSAVDRGCGTGAPGSVRSRRTRPGGRAVVADPHAPAPRAARGGRLAVADPRIADDRDVGTRRDPNRRDGDVPGGG